MDACLHYSIPRLPASGVASWNNMVVLGGSDLKSVRHRQP